MFSDADSRGLAILAVGAALVALFLAAALIGAFGNGVPQELWASAGALSGALVGVLVPAPKTPATPTASAAAATVNSAALNAAKEKGNEITSQDANQKQAVLDAIASVTRTALTPASGSTTAPAVAAATQHQAAAATTAANSPESVSAQITNAASQAATDAVPTALTQTLPFSAAPAAWLTWMLAGASQLVKPAALAAITYFALRTGIRLSDGAVVYKNCPVTTATASGQTVAPCAPALFQAGNALITLGAAAGGALVGLFAPASTSAAGAGGK